ncbi:uncharacterized protein TNCV_1870931 [Trichonephila clavipes]|nr:uncharacterized protein TNCV_1870931 [Trichonephila clavipes]
MEGCTKIRRLGELQRREEALLRRGVERECVHGGVAVWGFWTVKTALNPISGQDFEAGHDKSGVLDSAWWHDGDWMVDGIRKAWLRCFIWMEIFFLLG